ncbi:hypothetical protein F5984_21180 [Rudanella paleaurantiibacter]|uniref:histidine kinase n=1 Tax=Rudanella paleaurantiibacter TaxID=2614655 RepID=A0A7J5TU99_9BACT|nr:hypothetical protein [Rudanella paleaurantiibacter]KAB7727584.1 hypothetical protein F5984_21180 [Rudanella paleaurantiibacter]
MATKQSTQNSDIHIPPVVSLVSQEASTAPLDTQREPLTGLPAVSPPETQSNQTEKNDRLRAISHDLRSHFGVISGTANMLQMAQSDADRAHLITMMQRNLQQASELLTELLGITRL